MTLRRIERLVTYDWNGVVLEAAAHLRVTEDGDALLVSDDEVLLRMRVPGVLAFNGSATTPSRGRAAGPEPATPPQSPPPAPPAPALPAPAPPAPPASGPVRMTSGCLSFEDRLRQGDLRLTRRAGGSWEGHRLRGETVARHYPSFVRAVYDAITAAEPDGLSMGDLADLAPPPSGTDWQPGHHRSKLSDAIAALKSAAQVEDFLVGTATHVRLYVPGRPLPAHAAETSRPVRSRDPADPVLESDDRLWVKDGALGTRAWREACDRAHRKSPETARLILDALGRGKGGMTAIGIADAIEQGGDPEHADALRRRLAPHLGWLRQRGLIHTVMEGDGKGKGRKGQRQIHHLGPAPKRTKGGAS